MEAQELNAIIDSMTTYKKRKYTYEHTIHSGMIPDEIKKYEGEIYSDVIPDGFFKVDENGGSYEHAFCFNPTTMEYFKVLEWDYDDVRVDNNIYRHTYIDYEGEAFKLWFKLVYGKYIKSDIEIERKMAEYEATIPKVGDIAIVKRGRTLAKGFTGKIAKIFKYEVSYYKSVTYAVFETGEKVNIANIERVTA